MSNAQVYASLLVWLNLGPWITWRVYKNEIQEWIRTTIREEVSAVLGEDFPEDPEAK